VFLNEPERTSWDVHFSVLGIPVRVHPMFWIVSLFFGLSGSERDPMLALLWILAVFVSVLVHELGHAFAFRYFGAQPWITLYGMGGLASAPSVSRSSPRQIAISLAGPFTGFAFGALIVAVIAASGHQIRIDLHRLPGVPVTMQPFSNERLDELVWDLLFCNFFWNLVNLLPVLPLDGGQVCRETCQIFNPRDGMRLALMISTAVGAGMAVYALMKLHSVYMALLFGVLAFDSFTAMERLSGRGGGSGGRR
jgi:stage IV sporulation protein FB